MKQITPLSADTGRTVMVEMTSDEYLAFVQGEQQRQRQAPRVLRGLDGIRQLFQCSTAQAFKIAHSDWFQPARVQLGKLILFDADLAWSLAQAQSKEKPARKRA